VKKGRNGCNCGIKSIAFFLLELKVQVSSIMKSFKGERYIERELFTYQNLGGNLK
jgi:hypothetical protein